MFTLGSGFLRVLDSVHTNRTLFVVGAVQTVFTRGTGARDSFAKRHGVLPI